MPETIDNDVIKPYDGPPATPDNFTRAFPEMEKAATSGAPIQRGRIPLDQQSERNLADLRRQVRANPFPAATVINLHPWPLQSSDMFLRGIVIPACEPGSDIAYHHIRAWNHDKRYSEDGMSFIFTAIRPIEKAAQFLLKFADPQVYGGGVLIYEGDRQPGKMTEVELYSPDGRAMVDVKDGYEFDDEGNKLPSKIEIPIRGNLHKMIDQARRSRNEFYLSQVRWADERFKSADVKDRRLITNMHRLMMDVLVADGVLDHPLDWNLTSSLDKNKLAIVCKGCGSPVQNTAYKCVTCGNVIDAFEAFMDKAIEWGHAKLEDLSDEQFKVAKAEHERREAVKKSRAKKDKAE